MFTVIIPNHDRPHLLRRTLQSLIEQTWQDFKVIIVADSASYVPPYEALQALHGRYVYVLRSGVNGPAESRNMGLALADSPYVIFLDDDDTFEAGHLEALAARIGEDAPELLFCDFKARNEDRTSNPPTPFDTVAVSIADVTRASVFVRNRIPNSCLAYRRDVVAALRYDTAMLIYEDWDFLLASLAGRELRHVPVDSVVIHKSIANAPENMRRGNTRDDKIIEVMLQMYQKHPAPDLATRLARQALMVGAGVPVSLDMC